MRAALIVLAALFFSQTWAQAPAKDDEVQPRFIWGLLIQVAISKLASASFDMFTVWLQNRVPTVTDRSAPPNVAADSGAEIRARSSGAVAERASESVAGNPPAPLVVDRGRENYQGVHVALVATSADGKEFAYRPISGGFRTGERFKLRVVSTFGGELTLENVNPRGERRHIYPARSDYVVALHPGRETFLPLGRDEFFQFTKATGREQLIVNLADPRAVGAAASREQVYRQDQQYGSNFLQQVGPDSYPRLSQPIDLVHIAN